MFLYLFAIIFIVIFGLFIPKNDDAWKKRYCIISGTILFLLMALRDPTLGNSDTVSLYIPNFLKMPSLTFSEVFSTFFDRDVIFYFFTKVFTLFSQSIRLYFALCAFPFVFAVSRLIYKYSRIPSLSFTLFFSLNFYSWSFIVIRHSLALAFLIFSLDYLFQRKFFKFFLLVLFATCFHKTAIIFLLAYPLSKLKFNVKQFFFIFFCFGFVLLLKEQILDLIFWFINQGRYVLYRDRGSVMGISLVFVYLLVLLLAYFSTHGKGENIEKMFNLYWFGSLLTVFSLVLAELFRIGMFFSIIGIILLPNTLVDIQDAHTLKIIYFVVIFLCIFYGIHSFDALGLIPYIFN